MYNYILGKKARSISGAIQPGKSKICNCVKSLAESPRGVNLGNPEIIIMDAAQTAQQMGFGERINLGLFSRGKTGTGDQIQR